MKTYLKLEFAKDRNFLPTTARKSPGKGRPAPGTGPRDPGCRVGAGGAVLALCLPGWGWAESSRPAGPETSTLTFTFKNEAGSAPSKMDFPGGTQIDEFCDFLFRENASVVRREEDNGQRVT